MTDPAASPPSLDAPAEMKSSSSSSPIRDDQERSTASSRATAGRELDAQVAEKVMTLDPAKWRHRCFVERHNIDDFVWCYDCGRCADESDKIPPPFSTDIAAAFEVLGRIHSHDVTRENFWPFSKRMAFYKQLEFLCVTQGCLLVAWPAALGIFREQMPEFICRAALAVATDLNWRKDV